jgi:hypothetical protein
VRGRGDGDLIAEGFEPESESTCALGGVASIVSWDIDAGAWNYIDLGIQFWIERAARQ